MTTARRCGWRKCVDRKIQRGRGEGGFAMLLIFVMAASVAIMLYRELPRLVFESQRVKEQELIDRGEQYKRAIQLYVRKFKKYPASLDDLENATEIRFLRRRYKDPMTGKDEWRLIHIDNMGFYTDSLTRKRPQQQEEKKSENTFITEGAAFGSAAPAPGQGTEQARGAMIRGASDRPLVRAEQYRGVASPPRPPGAPPVARQPYPPGVPPPAAYPQPGQPGYPPGQPPYGQPGYPPPGYGQPGYPPPGYARPGAVPATPGYPVPGQPGYPQPGQPAQGAGPGYPPAPGTPYPQQGVPGLPGPYGRPQPAAPGYVSPSYRPPSSPPQPATPPQPGAYPQQPGGYPPQPGAPPAVPGAPQYGQPGVITPVQPRISPQSPRSPRPATPAYPSQGVPGLPGPYGPPTPISPSGRIGTPPTGAQPARPPGSPGTPATPGGGPNPALSIIQQILTTPRPGGLAGITGPAAGGGIGGGIAGVASTYEAEGIKVYNDHTKYNEWEFIYDYREDQASRARAAAGAAGAGSRRNPLGGSGPSQSQGFGSSSSFGGSGSRSGFGSSGSPGSLSRPQDRFPLLGNPVPPAPTGRP